MVTRGFQLLYSCKLNLHTKVIIIIFIDKAFPESMVAKELGKVKLEHTIIRAKRELNPNLIDFAGLLQNHL